MDSPVQTSHLNVGHFLMSKQCPHKTEPQRQLGNDLKLYIPSIDDSKMVKSTWVRLSSLKIFSMTSNMLILIVSTSLTKTALHWWDSLHATNAALGHPGIEQ